MAPHEGHGFSRAAQNSAGEGFIIAPGVGVSMLRSEQNLPCNHRTSAAKAVYAQEVYDTAEAVPFVQRLDCRKPNLVSRPFGTWFLIGVLTHAL
jgi:hypothetical protein